MSKKTAAQQAIADTRRIARNLYMRDGGHDGRFRSRVIPDKRKAAKRKACRRGKWG